MPKLNLNKFSYKHKKTTAKYAVVFLCYHFYMKNKLYFRLALLLALLVLPVVNVLAQAPTLSEGMPELPLPSPWDEGFAPPPFDPQLQNQINPLPQAGIYSISVDQNSYNQGDIVTGSFKLKNTGDVDINDVSYSVLLGSNYNFAGIPEKEYDESKNNQKIFLSVGEEKNISFNYVLPGNLYGENFGVTIILYSNGKILGSSSVTFEIIKIKEDNKWADVNLVFIKTQEEKVGPNAGPYIEEGDTLEVQYKNQSPNYYLAIPKIKIFNFVDLDNPLKEVELEKINFSENATSTLIYKLDLMDNKAGVYVGRLTLYDEEDNQISTDIAFRYMIDGDIGTITSIDVDKKIAQKNDLLKVLVNYMGKPQDPINPQPESEIQKGILKIKVFNENQELIGQNESEISFNEIAKVFEIKAISGASIIKVQSELYSLSGQLLSQYETQVTDPAKDYSRDQAFFNWTNIIFLILLALLISLLIFVPNKIFKTITKLCILIILLLLLSSFKNVSALTFYHNILYRIGDYYGHNDWRSYGLATQVAGLSVNPITNLNPGQYFSISGYYSLWGCYNTPSNTTISVYPNSNNSYQKYWTYASVYNSTWHSTGTILATNWYFDFYAPTTPGNYSAYIWTNNYQQAGYYPQNNWWANSIYLSGYEPYTVLSPSLISAVVFNDYDGDGIKDSNEPLIENNSDCGSQFENVSFKIYGGNYNIPGDTKWWYYNISECNSEGEPYFEIGSGGTWKGWAPDDKIRVGISSNNFPSGWATTTAEKIVDVSSGGINWVELGLKKLGDFDGQCGPAAKIYEVSDSAFVGSFCLQGNVFPASSILESNFPEEGKTTDWICQKIDSSGQDRSCSATRKINNINTDPSSNLNNINISNTTPSDIQINTDRVAKLQTNNSYQCEVTIIATTYPITCNGTSYNQETKLLLPPGENKILCTNSDSTSSNTLEFYCINYDVKHN